MTNVSFTGLLPAGLTLSTPNGLTNTCGGAVTTIVNAGGTSIRLYYGTLAAGASCIIAVNVTAVAEGALLNTTSTVTSNETGPGPAASATLFVGAFDAYQVKYASNLASGDSVFRITNTGVSGRYLCINVYAFSEEQLISCCSCIATPNSLVVLSAKSDLIANTSTAESPGSILVKLIATSGGQCRPSAIGTLGAGMVAFGSTIHDLNGVFQVTETPFTVATLTSDERARITSLCGFPLSNGGGYSICGSCRAGAADGVKK